MSARAADSECFAADLCLMTDDCPFIADCRKVEDADGD